MAILANKSGVATTLGLDKKQFYYFENYPLLSFYFWRNCHIIESSQINKKNYLRIICLDSPGVIGKIGDIFGKNNVSIESIVQLDASEDKAEIVVITHEVNNGDFERSKDEINSLNEVKIIASQLSCI